MYMQVLSTMNFLHILLLKISTYLMQWVMNCVRTKVWYNRITKHITTCLSVCCVQTNTYTYTHIHVTAKAVPRKKPAAKEEDDDLRELAAWASWTHLTLGQGRDGFLLVCVTKLWIAWLASLFYYCTQICEIFMLPVYIKYSQKTGLLASYICTVHYRLSDISLFQSLYQLIQH